jgi:hypothetical protein
LMCAICRGQSTSSTLMQKSASIQGRVVDSIGDPLPETVSVYRLEVRDGRLFTSTACATSSDKEGLYRCDNLLSGSYIVLVTALESSLGTEGRPSSLLFPTTFYPEETSIDRATRLQISDAQTTWAGVSVRPIRSFRLQGRLPANLPFVVFGISMHGEDFDIPLTKEVVYSDSSGRFTVDDLSEGTYRVTADWFAENVNHHSSGLVVLNAGSQNTIRLDADTTTDVYGAMHYESDLHPALPSEIVLEGTIDNNRVRYTSHVNAAGQFQFPSVHQGRYELYVQDGDTIVQTVSSDSRSISPFEVIVGDSARLLLAVGLSTEAGEIAGHVSGGEVLSKTIPIIVQNLGSGRIRVIETDAQQRFQIDGLSPGDYTLYAWMELEDIQYQNPGFLGRFARDATTVRVEGERSVTDVELNVIRAPRAN